MANMVGGNNDGMMKLLESLPMGMGGGMGLFSSSQQNQVNKPVQPNYVGKAPINKAVYGMPAEAGK